MWQMLRWLLQWLNRFLKYPFDSRRTHDSHAAEGHKVVDPPPELTNADLELLFNELLEGVHQARGQQWALKYLQRMEPRITVERWLDWLLIFGEKLLASPAPNSLIATRMVQLGELGIGHVGELAYDIGIQLLRRNFVQEYEDNPAPVEVEITNPTELLGNTPGQQLLRDFGEELWEHDHQEAVNITPVSPNLEEVWTLLSQENQEPDLSVAFSYEYSEDDSPVNLEDLEQVPTSSLTESWDQSLVNIEPKVAQTLDELVVRLEQSTNLVQQLASELAIRDSQAIIERPSFQLTVTNQAQAWFYQGLQQAKSGDLLGALAFYNQATKLEPESHEYWFNQGLTLFHLQRFEEAIAAYDQAVALKPDFYQAWYNRGGILGEFGDFEQAITCFDKAIEFKPDYQEAWSSRGLALLKLGLIWEAISSYDQALNLQHQDQETWYYRGVALAVCEQYEDAIASYDRALDIQPDYHEVWIDRGVVLFNLNRWLEAIESWDQALSVQSDFYLAWYNRGIALENLGRREEAITSYKQAISIKPDFHPAWYNQAVALFYLNRFSEAIACYDHALEIKLDYWEAWLGRGGAVGNLVNDKLSLILPSSIATANPALNQRGYEGKLATYEEGLKYLRPDTHPEGWGRLHIAIGNTHYEHGKKQPSPRYFWQKAVSEYQQALLTLTAEDFSELHLDVLQSLTKVLVGLGQTAPAQELQQHGLDLLQQLLNQTTRSEQSKKQLALKFAGLRQLGVDLAVNVGDLVEAWEIAEERKNTCLKLLIYGWSNDIDKSHEIYSSSYDAIQQLLNSTTAIIYWHLSPIALHTFIIKDEAPSPILLLTPIQDVEAIPEAVQRLVNFENWLEDWHQQYQEYRQIDDIENQHNHSWKLEMEQRLLHLHNILNISTIIQELEGITNLIVIPHRDLNRLPIHALFPLSQPDLQVNYTINYLPSIQIGLSLKTELLSNWQQQKFLSVENLESTEQSAIKSADFTSAIVRQMFDNSQHIKGSQVTKDNLENALVADYNIFHFTGHAINNLNETQKSALVLAGEDKITLEQLCQHSFTNYRLFTLINSEIVSNNSQNISSEYVGLATGLLKSGVPYVLSTIWNVESSATALVSIEFYRRLVFHTSPIIALAEATTWLKEITVAELITWYENLLINLHPDELRFRNYISTQIDKNSKLASDKQPYHHPYYWAAFMITGCD
ncbi:CHAT domain-containing protein [Anabaena catenula]|uniref:Tetratricopeptide repeat protein n=1 Tax=Anabaena catenula FACHB-362 TaxID=2692877 RepID=A0ABR8J455_9NOST|nr:tetratricopeptide repeat protein [Anabaena catenula]MBD2692388.1 tetratricopeptide repeat protein [Anabaena catenula FACHB-362]